MAIVEGGEPGGCYWSPGYAATTVSLTTHSIALKTDNLCGELVYSDCVSLSILTEGIFIVVSDFLLLKIVREGNDIVTKGFYAIEK